MAQITATGNYPDDNGVALPNDGVVCVSAAGGSGVGIAGNIQYRDSEGAWATLPTTTLTTPSLIAERLTPVYGGDGMRIRLNVTAFTSGYYSYGIYKKDFS